MMARLRMHPSVALLAVAALAATGCGPRVQTMAKVQPKVEEAAELRRVAVMGFQGPEAEQASAAFETMLVSHSYDGRPYFTVVDRRQTKAVMAEHAKSLRGEVDAKTAARFGKQMGVQGVYFGDITVASVTPRHYTAEESYCTQYNSSGRKCRQWGSRTVSCTERIATFTLMPRLVDVETGRVVYRAEHTGESKDSSCGNSSGLPDSQLLDNALHDAVGEIISDIAPQEKLTWVRLMDEPTGLGESEAAEFKRGLAFANAGRMDRACTIWRQLNSSVEGKDNALLFNVAVCTETEGDPATALRIFEEVDGRLAEPDSNVNAALTRVKATLAAE